jgi:hypothetical protein
MLLKRKIRKEDLIMNNPHDGPMGIFSGQEDEKVFKRFYGTLSIENAEKISNKILSVLKDKKYIFVTVYEYRGYEPETRVNQELHNGNNGTLLNFWYGENKEYAGFYFCDSYGIWGCSTSSKDGQYDSEFNSPYIVINPNQITITQRTPAGMMCYWQITIQDE